jgi:hypothetical protein
MIIDHLFNSKLTESKSGLQVGDPVVITGNVQFQGKTGDVVDIGRNGDFVVVDLYNHGRKSFHSSDVSHNDYAGSDDEQEYQQRVAEGISVVDSNYDLDQMTLTLDIEGTKKYFTYWDYDENFENAERKDVFAQLQEQPWYASLDHPTKMEILDAAYRAIRGLEPSEYRPTVGDEPLAEAGPFSYGAKKPRKGSVADLAARKRKEQERGRQPIEPRDQMVGVAKVIKDVAEGSVQDKLHQRHQELRKKSGLPDPNYYKELKATYDLPDQERYVKAAELKKKYNVKESQRTQCPECGGAAYEDRVLAEKQDACYHKVRSRYKVWPSAYASGALVQCRKKGAANWGNKSK